MKFFHETQVPWPPHKPRTINRKKGQFKVASISAGAERVRQEVDRFTPAAKSWRTTELWIFAPGQLGASNRFLANHPKALDPAVVVTFDLDNQSYSIACDTYTLAEQNLAAIAEHIKSLRAAERYGVETIHDLLRNHLALPAATNWFEGCEGAEISARYRELVKAHHPDRGGDPSIMAEINAQHQALTGGKA